MTLMTLTTKTTSFLDLSSVETEMALISSREEGMRSLGRNEDGCGMVL